MNDAVLRLRLQQQKRAHLYRQRMILQGPSNCYVHDGAQSYVSFCSNDYLGLANDPRVIAAFKKGADQYGVGSGAAQLICGHRRAHHDLEQQFAQFVGFPRALLFANGFMANLGVLTALTRRQDVIYQDRQNHASLIDAGRLALAKSRRYLHADLFSLIRLLQQSLSVDANTNIQRFIVTDGVFSMNGELAPITSLLQLTQQYRAKLIVDDAHGIGVLGQRGAGILEHLNISITDDVVLVCPLGKAFGCYGALVLGSEIVIETLIQFARSYMFTTAPPPALASAALMSLHLIQHESWRRERLNNLITFFGAEAQQRQLPITLSNTAIQTLVIGDNVRTLQIAQSLQQRGILVVALRPPTVQQALLRITLRVDHSEKQVIELLEQLKVLLETTVDI